MPRVIRTSVLMIGAALFVVGSAVAQQNKGPETVILKGNPMGGVKFTHAAHQKLVDNKCETCHHASKPERPTKPGAEQQKCSDCHTKTPTAPMKTGVRAAFHDPMAKKGICADCHTQQLAKGNTKVPQKCADCHKKENV
jgi:cytochrome c5